MAKSTKDVPPQRESRRIRLANEANKVQIEVDTANTIISAAVNDSIQSYFKSNAFSRALTSVVKGNLFEGAVTEASKHVPVHKSALKKAVDENSASVHDILLKSLQPQLEKAAKDFKTEAENAGKAMKTSAQTLRLVVEELKEESADAEASGDLPIEVKKGGRKARGKKAAKSASLDKSGEEEALLTGTAQEKYAEVITQTFSNTLSDKVDPSFKQLNVAINSGLQQSVQVIGQRSSADNVILQKHLEVVTVGLSSLEKTVTDNLGALGGSWDQCRREIREIAKTCADMPRFDGGAGTDKRKRVANASKFSTPSVRQKTKRAAHNPPSSPSSPELDNSSSESSAGPLTPSPQPKKRGRPGRTPSSAMTKKPLSSIDPNTLPLAQLQQELADLKKQQLHREQQQQPQQQPQHAQQPQYQLSQQPSQPQPQQQPQHVQQTQYQLVQQPSQQQQPRQHVQQPQHQLSQQPLHPQSHQPPALQQQQHQMTSQMGVAHPVIGDWKNVGIPALPPQAQTATTPLPGPLPYPYLSFQG